MRYKTELHCHSKGVSACGTLYPERIVERYREEGYTTVVLTNHLSKSTYYSKKHDVDYRDWSWEQKVDLQIGGFERFRRCAESVGMHALLGCELGLNGIKAHYLLFGMTEAFMREHPDIMQWGVREMSEQVHAAGMLLFQAHPFRNNMYVTNPTLLDGVEVYNGSIGHDSRNDIAYAWAQKLGLRMSSGTDFHHEKHIIAGGIETEVPITSNEQLLEILRRGEYDLIRRDSVPF